MSHPAGEALIRPATPADLGAAAAIRAERDGGPPAAYLPVFEAILERDPKRDFLLVAHCCDEVVGYGRAGRYDPADDAPSDTVPAGHYLFGVVVRPDHRRRGIGRALTEARIDRLRPLTDRVYYFANARNAASIALHEQLGFVEVTRDFSYPGVTFDGGEGVLCRLDPSTNHE